VQDNERMALTVIANTLDSGGYYPLWENYSTTSTVPVPTPLLNTLDAFPTAATLGFKTAGQYIYGTTTTAASGTTAAGEQITVRYMTDNGANGNQLDCLGQTHPNLTLVTNIYTVSTNPQQGLMCQVNTTPYGGTATVGNAQAVVAQVSQLQAVYGVDPTGTGSVTEYMTSATVTSNTYWQYVRSVMVTVTFANPLYVAGQPGQPESFTVTRVIAVPQTTVSI
jgi:type IV pilus assembly protein PilW